MIRVNIMGPPVGTAWSKSTGVGSAAEMKLLCFGEGK